MKITNLTLATICLICITSCSPDKTEKSTAAKESTSTTSVVSDAIYPLGQVIHLPIQPESVKFQTINLAKISGDPNAEEFGIVALMRFSDANLKAFLDQAAVIEAKNLPEKFAFSWLKPTLDANFKPDAAGSFYEFKKPVLNAEYFYRSPLIQGAAYQVSANEILVYLHTQQ